jgi:hypothetical protein
VDGTVYLYGGFNQEVAGASVFVMSQSAPTAGPPVFYTAVTNAKGYYAVTVPSGGVYGVQAVKGAGVTGSAPVSLGNSSACPVTANLVLSCPGVDATVGRKAQCEPSWCCVRLDCLGQYNCPDGNRCSGAKGCGNVDCGERATCATAGTPEFCQAGCLLMCVAMLTGRDPVELNRDLSSSGLILSNGRMRLRRACRHLGLGRVDERSYSPLLLAQALMRGVRVIAEVPGHFVVVTGVEMSPEGVCRFRIADPAGRDGDFSVPRHRFLTDDEDSYLSVVSLRLICPSTPCVP